jgi:hypothetical protein
MTSVETDLELFLVVDDSIDSASYPHRTMARTSSSQAGEIQVSAEVLSSLISSVEELRRNVSALQVEKTEIEKHN